jgi:hypothetical protein
MPERLSLSELSNAEWEVSVNWVVSLSAASAGL